MLVPSMKLTGHSNRKSPWIKSYIFNDREKWRSWFAWMRIRPRVQGCGQPWWRYSRHQRRRNFPGRDGRRRANWTDVGTDVWSDLSKNKNPSSWPSRLSVLASTRTSPLRLDLLSAEKIQQVSLRVLFANERYKFSQNDSDFSLISPSRE